MRGKARLTRIVAAPKSPGGSPLIAAVDTPDGVFGFAALDGSERIPGPDWASGAVTPVVMGPVVLPPSGEEISASALLAATAAGNSHLIWIGPELDGPMAGFGRRFWQMIEKKARSFAEALRGEEVVQATYTDRYLQTPLNIRLLAEVCRRSLASHPSTR